MGTKIKKARKAKRGRARIPDRGSLCFDHRDPVALATFNAAVTGFCASRVGAWFEQDREVAARLVVLFAESVVLECQLRVAKDSDR